MKNDGYSLKYPRKVLLRKGMVALGRILLALLADVKIRGGERLPDKGPIILAGNHVAVLEAVMMAVYTPGLVEFVGTGDIPFDPNYAFIANTYDLIPVNRGNLDQKGLQMGLDVLAQDGILGIFPEGGTWSPAQMQAQIGVAWLSYKSKAPVLPIGFGGIKGGLEKALHFKHPRLVMNVGEIMPPVILNDPDASLKANLSLASTRIMKKINNLIPEKDLKRFRRRVDETFELEVDVHDHEIPLELPEEFQIKHGSAYARLMYNPTMMDVLVRNIHLPIKPLKSVYHQSNLNPVLRAWDAILDYLQQNPGYFTYRFGVEIGLAVKEALLELRNLGKWADESGYALTINPIRYYQNANTGAHVVERGGCFPKSM